MLICDPSTIDCPEKPGSILLRISPSPWEGCYQVPMKIFNLQASQMQQLQSPVTGQIPQLLTIFGDSTELIPFTDFFPALRFQNWIQYLDVV